MSACKVCGFAKDHKTGCEYVRELERLSKATLNVIEGYARLNYDGERVPLDPKYYPTLRSLSEEAIKGYPLGANHRRNGPPNV